MSSSSASNHSDNSFEIDDLIQIGATRMELRKEKDMLRESHLKSDALIKLSATNGWALDVKSLSEARKEDRKHIQELESKLQNCSEEIGALKCQVNMRNIEANWLGEHVHSLELKLTEMNKLQSNVNQLTEELLASNSECWSLRQELENKEVELHNSTMYVERLEEAISSISLDSECELESMKLDLMNLEQMVSEAKTFQEKATQEKEMTDGIINEFSVQIQDAQEMIELLKEENRDLRGKLEISEQNSKLSVQRIEEYLNEWLEKKEKTEVNACSSSKPEDLQPSQEFRIYEEILGAILSKFGVVETSDLKDEMKKMSRQIYDYELLVKQLKDELREVKLKAKEEAEDLTQEMAELRYQTITMLDEECGRRAHIEQASLQRISELEAQVQKEQRKSFLAAKHLSEVQKLAESKFMEIQHLRNFVQGSCTSAQSEECLSIMDRLIEEASEVGDRVGQLSIEYFPEERHLPGELNQEDSSD